MLAWNLNLDDVNYSLTEAILKHDFDLDRARDSKDMHLESLHKWELKLGPLKLLHRCL